MKRILVLLLCFGLSGCVTTPKPGMVWMYTKPSAKYEKDPSIDFSKYKKFSVFPQAELNKESKMNPIVEKQILFMIRNTFERLGYKYVDNPEEADFFVSVYYSNEYKSEYIPPSTYTIPWYVPEQIQTTFINNYNTFSGNIGSEYFYGSGSGWGTVTTITPGYYVPMTFTTPGGYVGWYYPCVLVSVFDKNSKKIVWTGSAVATTPQADIRLSAQVILSDIFGRKEPNFPLCADPYLKDDSGDGAFGIFPYPITTDGNNFYPSIDALMVNSPAYKLGLKPGDIITQIDKKVP
jgi:hypothetical protein